MFGSLQGNILGISYFLLFQILGILLSLKLLHRQKPAFAILIGSVLGSFALQWLPALYAFFLNFTIVSHVFALFTFVLIVAAVFVRCKDKGFPILKKQDFTLEPILFLLVPLYIFVIIMLNKHTIPYIDDSLHSGQSTYGDMNMHLGFITSIAKQQTFPPEYSILPGTKLAYPFLSDSISSSIYLWGSSLRAAYLFPMYFALAQVFFGMYALAKQLLYVVNKSCRGKTILAFIFFFFNGGFGFYYFINQGFDSDNFKRIFTAFYETPTNYVSENIQWHNVICDMLIPQRATLFGWAVLFPVLALLMKGRKNKDLTSFILSGILSGGLVLIHTHSFLALGVLCAVFLVQDLAENMYKKEEPKRWPVISRLVLVAMFLASMTFLSIRQRSDNALDSSLILSLGIAVLAFFAGILAYHMKKGLSKEILMTWGVFLGIVLLLAVPQLFGFTFRQAQGEQFVRGSFNWANSTDGYMLFYLKNLGILFILTILMLIFGTRKQIQIALPACLLWIVCEFILFQPNPYDNNKLLLVAYLFFCIAVSDFVWDTVPSLIKNHKKLLRGVTVTATVVLSSFAAILTIGREYVSDYELYSSDYVELCQWVEENTSPADIFLTATNHNNAIASLTGRNIVCGSGTFLYYHGVNYQQNEADVQTMYEQPEQRDALLKQYNVSYIVVGPWEWSNYSIPDLEEMYTNYDVVYNENGVVVLAV